MKPRQSPKKSEDKDTSKSKSPDPELTSSKKGSAPVDPAVETKNRKMAGPEETSQEKNREALSGRNSGVESP